MIECSAWANCSEDCANYTFYHNYWHGVDRLLRYDETSDSVHHLCKHTQPGTSTLHAHQLSRIVHRHRHMGLTGFDRPL